MNNENLQLNSDFAYEQYAGATITFGPPPVPGSVAITVLNGVTGPTVTFVGGSSGFTFSPAGTTIILGSPLTTKGDILVRDATAGTRLPIGAHANGEVLTLDSAEATGMKWAAPAAGSALNEVSISDIDSPYALSNANDAVWVDTSSGPVTVTLHDPVTATQKVYIVKLVRAGNTETIDGDGVTVDGAATLTTAVQYVSFSLVPSNADGVWYVV